MGIVACYDLNLYCDHADCMTKWNYAREPGQYTGYDRNSTVRKARKAGWLINTKADAIENGAGSGRCLCPLHSGKTIKKES